MTLLPLTIIIATNMKKTIFLIILLLLTVSSVSCKGLPAIKVYWIQNPDGTFHTNDIKRLQQKISFKIIVPTFFPEVLNSGLLNIWGPFKVKSGNGVEGIQLQIEYQKDETQLLIWEDNLGEVLNPNPDLEPKYININGIKILRQKAQSVSASGMEEGVRFDWTLNGISYKVKIYSISEDDGLKIVESMISQ